MLSLNKQDCDDDTSEGQKKKKQRRRRRRTIMFEEYNREIRTSRELTESEFEDFEYKPKKKVRELFKKLVLMSSSATASREYNNDNNNASLEVEVDDGEQKKKKQKRTSYDEDDDFDDADDDADEEETNKKVTQTEMMFKLNEKYCNAVEEPRSSERIITELLSSSALSVENKNSIHVKEKRKTKKISNNTNDEGEEEQVEVEDKEEETQTLMKLKRAKEAMEAAATSRKVHKLKDHEGLKSVIEKRDFAGMVMEVEKTYKEGSKEAKLAEENERAKARGLSGLDALILKLEKSKKLSVLDKTKMDWKKVKDTNEDIDEELALHRKSKNTYVEQQNFLQQAEYREYEKERDARLGSNQR